MKRKFLVIIQLSYTLECDEHLDGVDNNVSWCSMNSIATS